MNDKIAAAQNYCRNEGAWTLFWKRFRGAWSATLVGIYDGANRGEYEGTFNWF